MSRIFRPRPARQTPILPPITTVLTDNGTISNWLISPELDFAATGRITFWTRTVDTPAFPDRLQVRLSTGGASTNVGTAATDVGDFTTLLLDINPTYTVVDYPVIWTQYTISSADLPASGTGRIAFRYFVEDAGALGTNSDYIGIDTFEVFSRSYTLTYVAGANGTISGTTPQTVDQGADGTAVTAVPNTGYHFVNWSDGSTANPRTDTNVMADLFVTANFAINTYTLTYTAGANGTITGTSPQTVNHGASGTAVTAVPNTGYHFVNWSDGSTANPRTDSNVTANISVTANFAINTYTLTYTAGANGTITGTTPQTVNHGASGTAVTAVPNTGYHFVNWSDGSTANPRTDTNVTANISVTANFAINTYTLTYTAGANGTISGTSPQTVNHGASGTAVTAVPNTGYHFVDWSDGFDGEPAHRYQCDREHLGDGELRDQHLHPDLHGRGQRHDHRHVAADGESRCVGHGGDRGAEHRLPLRRLERRLHGQPAHRYQCDREHLGDGELRDQHLHPDLHGRGQRHDYRHVAADGESRRVGYGGDRGAEHRLPLRRLERRLDGEPAHRYQCDREHLGDGELRHRHPDPDGAAYRSPARAR